MFNAGFRTSDRRHAKLRVLMVEFHWHGKLGGSSLLRRGACDPKLPTVAGLRMTAIAAVRMEGEKGGYFAASSRWPWRGGLVQMTAICGSWVARINAARPMRPQQLSGWKMWSNEVSLVGTPGMPWIRLSMGFPGCVY